jgi:hypothetical protein
MFPDRLHYRIIKSALTAPFFFVQATATYIYFFPQFQISEKVLTQFFSFYPYQHVKYLGDTTSFQIVLLH